MNDYPRPVTGNRRSDYRHVFHSSREPGALAALVAVTWLLSIIL